jgi:YHS domain-containing protein
MVAGARRGLYSRGVPKRRRVEADGMAIEIDPVCGMEVDTEMTDLNYTYHDTTYWFCGRGCLLDFKDDPEKFLAEDHQPSM